MLEMRKAPRFLNRLRQGILKKDLKFSMMLRTLLSLLGLFLLISLCSSQTITDCIAECEKQHFAQGLTPPQRMAVHNSNFVYHRCHWTIDPAVHYIEGKVTTHFIPFFPINVVEFDLKSGLIVDSVKSGSVRFSHSHLDDILYVQLPVMIPGGRLDSVTVYYHGVPANSGFGSFVQSEHDSFPIIWTLSEPYGARDWWPCKQSLQDKIDSVDVLISTPASCRAASNGVLVSETMDGQENLFHWKERYPIATYLICLAVTNFAEYAEQLVFGSDTVDILNYIWPEDLETARSQIAHVTSQMQLYNSLFGLYPFSKEKYGHVQIGWGGGMEHQTFTFVGGFGYELLAHELAHQWFGDAVTCGSWEDVWLNEGFATYLSGLCYEFLLPGRWKPFLQGRIDAITSAPDGSVLCTDTTDIHRIFNGRLSYSKGAMILHTLRWVIGDGAFFEGIRNYLKDPHIAFGFALTSQFQRHLEQASGRSLQWYFDDWYVGEGFPSYGFEWSQNAHNELSLSVFQAQSHPSVPFFELPIPVQLEGGNRDTMLVLQHDYSGQKFSIGLDFQVDSLIFDPDRWIISANNKVITSVETVSGKEAALRVFPNPARGKIYLEWEASSDGEVVLMVRQVAGQVVEIAKGACTPGINRLEFTTEGWNGGLYSAELRFISGSSFGKSCHTVKFAVLPKP